MKIVSYNEMIQQPDGTICAPYYDGKLGDFLRYMKVRASVFYT